MSRAFFEQVADALVGFLPPSLRAFSVRVTARNVKVWYGEDAHEHYEVQVVPRAAVTTAKGRARGPALEVGFHAEHPDASSNEAVLDAIVARERSWRRALGADATAGPFVGRQRAWRRLSDLWDDVATDDPGAAVEAADRLAAYITTIEPLRTSRTATTRAKRTR